MYGDKIRELRESKGIGINELSRLSGVSAGYISSLERGEKKNPSSKTLEKLAKALGIYIEGLMGIPSTRTPNNLPTNFITAESAMKFILEQPVVMGYGGFDINKLTDKDIINFANDLLEQLKLLSYKYKK